MLRAGLLAAALGPLSCTSILGDFGDEVIPGASSSSASAGSTGGGGSGQGGKGGMGGEGGAGGAGGAAGGAGGQGGASTICPSGQGPTMVLVPSDGGDPYCIDSTEVTIAQYFQWLNTAPDPKNQAAVCGWNTVFEPDLTGSCQGAPVDPGVAPDYPIVCVDWCDAFAYCSAAGKRLCGKIGGGQSPFGSAADPAINQWFRACSEGGAKPYPYGSQYSGTTCVGNDFDGQVGYQLGSDVPHEVGTEQECEGGYLGIYDLSGNVKEWEDSCETMDGSTDKCNRRGGSFKDNAAALTCASQPTSPRNSTTIDLGFRCCAETIK